MRPERRFKPGMDGGLTAASRISPLHHLRTPVFFCPNDGVHLNALTENRNGLVVDVRLTQATGTAERDAGKDMISGKAEWRRVTLGGDRNYDTRGFVAELRARNVTPHVAQNDNNRRSAIDNRTTRHKGYEISQRKRKRIEEVFGWIKTIALQRKTRFRGLERVGWMFTLAASAYNLVRMRNLQVASA